MVAVAGIAGVAATIAQHIGRANKHGDDHHPKTDHQTQKVEIAQKKKTDRALDIKA